MKKVLTIVFLLISSVTVAEIDIAELDSILISCHGNLSVTDGGLVISLPTKIQYLNDNDILQWGADSVNCLSKIMRSSDLKLLITGHADENGSSLANHILAKNRAKGIKSMLINSGVEEGRVFISSKGETAPLVNSKSKYVANRRVELELKQQ